MKTLITGHGHFAEGMKSALELIAGPQKEIETLVFLESTQLQDFQELLFEFCSGDDEVFIFTDLMGGSPFNMSMIAKADKENVHVLTGTNLPMLLEYVALTMMKTESESLPAHLSTMAKEGITFDLAIHRSNSKKFEESDGI